MKFVSFIVFLCFFFWQELNFYVIIAVLYEGSSKKVSAL
jgi:hypothetical protein